jgi:hypothetical protein
MWLRIRYGVVVLALAAAEPRLSAASLPRLTQVEEELAGALRQNPLDDRAMCDLARSLLLRREYPSALECAQVLADRHPRSVYYRLLTAECMAGMGWKERAAGDLEALMHEVPLNPAVRHSLGALGVLVAPPKVVSEVQQLRQELTRDLCHRYLRRVTRGVEARGLRTGERPVFESQGWDERLLELVESRDLEFAWVEPTGTGRYLTDENKAIYCTVHGHAPPVSAEVEPEASCLDQALKDPDRATVVQLVQRARHRRDPQLAARLLGWLGRLATPEEQLLVLEDLNGLFGILPAPSGNEGRIPASWLTSPHKSIRQKAFNAYWLLGIAAPMKAFSTGLMMDSVGHGEVPVEVFGRALKTLCTKERKALAAQLATAPLGLARGPILELARLKDPDVLAALARRLDGAEEMQRDVVRSALETVLGQDAGEASGPWLELIRARVPQEAK